MFAIFVLTALAQVGISTQFLTLLVGIVFDAAALTVALAFGLGSCDVARQVSAGRYVSGAFRVGQTITVDGVRGEIVALESAATVVRADDGRTLASRITSCSSPSSASTRRPRDASAPA